MPPKRKQGRDLPPNLYQSIDKRDMVTRFRYRDPRNGRFHGLGTDKDAAVKDAKALNAAIYASFSRIPAIVEDKPDTPKLSSVILKHLEIAEVMAQRGKIKPQTVVQNQRLAKPLVEAFGNKPIGEVTVLDVAGVIKRLANRFAGSFH